MIDPKAKYCVYSWDHEKGSDGGWQEEISGAFPREMIREVRKLRSYGYSGVSILVEREDNEENLTVRTNYEEELPSVDSGPASEEI